MVQMSEMAPKRRCRWCHEVKRNVYWGECLDCAQERRDWHIENGDETAWPGPDTEEDED